VKALKDGTKSLFWISTKTARQSSSLSEDSNALFSAADVEKGFDSAFGQFNNL
jgi:hypothetical protein